MYSPKTPIPINCTPPRKSTDTKSDGYPLTGLPKAIVTTIIHAPYMNATPATNRPI